MGLSILVRLREGRYDAGGLAPTQPEWPPHPARLFCALVASATDGADRQALAWLEAAGPPQVWASGDTAAARSSGYVVLNACGGGGSQTWPGRSNGIRQRVSALPADDTYAVVWPQAEPDDATLARLVRLAGRVPYVGRSTSTAEVSVVAEVVAVRPGWTCFVPVPLGTPHSLPVRVPFPGYLQALDDAYEDGVRAWQVATHTLAYAPAPAQPAAEAVPGSVEGPYRDLLVWGVRRPAVPIGGDDLLTVTEALRRAVLARVADPLPAQVSGHGADGRPHVAYLGLLDVGHRHADGHLLGVAMAVPQYMPSGDRRALLRGVLGAGAQDPISELRDGRGRRIPLRYNPEQGKGVQSRRWGHARSEREWVTATPLMLDRFPTRTTDLTEVVSASLVTAGYPRPELVEALPAPPLRGAVARMRAGTVAAAGRPRRPMLHCRVTFPRPVSGPVLAGALRYLGGGLFVPEVVGADS